jgi:hypothetical protein
MTLAVEPSTAASAAERVRPELLYAQWRINNSIDAFVQNARCRDNNISLQHVETL